MDDMSPQRTNPWMLSTFLLIGLIVGFGVAQVPGLGGWASGGQVASLKAEQKDNGPAPSPAAPQEPRDPVLTEEQIKSLPDDDPLIGEANAPITLVEFSDFQCPFCSKFFTESFLKIEQNYINTGKVKFVYRDFPLDFHPQAFAAAEAAQCADEQGKFKEMHDMIFQNQTEWAGNPDAPKLFKGYAKKLGLSSSQFDSCLDTNKSANEVRKDLIDGVTVGVNGTPAFFVNGKYLSGAMPYEEVFKPIFEAELAGKKWELQIDPATRRPIIKTL